MSLITQLTNESYLQIEAQLDFCDLAKLLLTSKTSLGHGRTFKSLQIKHESLSYSKLRFIASVFSSLESLSISDSTIPGYDSLKNLSLSKLTHLKLKGNKFLIIHKLSFSSQFELVNEPINLDFAHSLPSLKRLEINFVNWQLYNPQASKLKQQGIAVIALF